MSLAEKSCSDFRPPFGVQGMTSGRSPAFGLLTGSAQLGDNWTFAACGAIGIGDAAQKKSPKIFPKPQNEKNGGIRGWGIE